MLGALLKVIPLVSVDAVVRSIEKKFTKKLGEEKTQANVKCIKDAFNEVKVG